MLKYCSVKKFYFNSRLILLVYLHRVEPEQPRLRLRNTTKTYRYLFKKLLLSCSVAELNHFSSAPAPDIFFFGFGSRLKVSAPASPIKARLRPAPAPKNRLFYKTFEKSELKNASINLDFVTKIVITYKK